MKEIDFLAEITKSSPVLGFLPGRAFFFKIEKLPKPLNFTSSPFSKQFVISSKKELKRLLFSEIYPQRLYLINEKVFLSTPFNSIFPFSVNIISLESSEIQNTLIDDRDGPLKYR